MKETHIQMKKIRALLVLTLFTGILLGATSCTVFFSKDNGKHKGWYKNHDKGYNQGFADQGKHVNKDKK
jgi:hypothetical protein